jgi:ferredoxin
VITVRFIAADGHTTEVEAAPGARLLAAAQIAGSRLEGTCEGQMACATCHVIVDPADFARLPPASADEEDMLDLAPHATAHSRLSCQVVLDEALGAITVQVPG